MFSDEIISNAVEKYWNEHYNEDDVVCYFSQRYVNSNWCTEHVVVSKSLKGYIVFDWDFCEGQTEVKDILIVPLETVLHYFGSNFHYDANGKLKLPKLSEYPTIFGYNIKELIIFAKACREQNILSNDLHEFCLTTKQIYEMVYNEFKDQLNKALGAEEIQ